MNSSMNAVQSYQAGLSMGERDYYLEMMRLPLNSWCFPHTRTEMYQLAGFDEAAAKKVWKL